MEGLIEIKGKFTTDMESFQFCFMAMSLIANENRIYCSHVMIDNGFAHGTDGRSLHMAKLKGDYISGLYRVLKKNKTHIILLRNHDCSRYPDITTMLSASESDTFPIDLQHNEWLLANKKINSLLPEQKLFNPLFLKNIKGSYDISIIDVSVVKLSSEDKLAFIMMNTC